MSNSHPEITIRQEAINAHKEEYVLLATLNELNELPTVSELKRHVNSVVDGLTDTDIESPIHFAPTNAPHDIESKTFNTTFNRCKSCGYIDTPSANVVQLTLRGKEFTIKAKSPESPLTEFATKYATTAATTLPNTGKRK